MQCRAGGGASTGIYTLLQVKRHGVHNRAHSLLPIRDRPQADPSSLPHPTTVLYCPQSMTKPPETCPSVASAFSRARARCTVIPSPTPRRLENPLDHWQPCATRHLKRDTRAVMPGPPTRYHFLTGARHARIASAEQDNASISPTLPTCNPDRAWILENDLLHIRDFLVPDHAI